MPLSQIILQRGLIPVIVFDLSTILLPVYFITKMINFGRMNRSNRKKSF